MCPVSTAAVGTWLDRNTEDSPRAETEAVQSSAVATALLGLGSLLPAVGVAVFGWGPTAVATVYVAEMLALVCSYAAVALVAQRPSAVDERERTELPLLPTPSPEWLPERIDLSGLPPIRAENVRIVVFSGLFYLVVALSLGSILTGSFGTASSPDRRVPVDVFGFLGAVAGRLDPVVAALSGVVVLSQLGVVFLWYVAPSRHRTLSAYVVAQRLSRLLFAHVVFAAVWYAFGSLLSAALDSFVSVDRVTLLVVGFCLIKLSSEQRRVAGESSTDGDGRGAWLVPDDRSRQ